MWRCLLVLEGICAMCIPAWEFGLRLSGGSPGDQSLFCLWGVDVFMLISFVRVCTVCGSEREFQRSASPHLPLLPYAPCWSPSSHSSCAHTSWLLIKVKTHLYSSNSAGCHLATQNRTDPREALIPLTEVPFEALQATPVGSPGCSLTGLSSQGWGRRHGPSLGDSCVL